MVEKSSKGRNLWFVLIHFCFYLGSPFQKDAKVKDTCAKLNSSFQITGDEAMKA